MKVVIDIDPEVVALEILKESIEVCSSFGDSEDLRMLIECHNYFACPSEHVSIDDVFPDGVPEEEEAS